MKKNLKKILLIDLFYKIKIKIEGGEKYSKTLRKNKRKKMLK